MKHWCSPEIGKRFFEEINRMFPDKSLDHLGKIFGCNRKTVGEWRDGTSPSAIYLARFLNLNGDVKYVLTGRRQTKEIPPEFLAELEEEYD